MYCQNCGTRLDDGALFCPNCGYSVSGSGRANGAGCGPNMASIMVNKKSEALALILSLIIPGLGQIYNDETKKGIMMILGTIVLAVLTALIFFSAILYLVLWVWGMYDAFTQAKYYNQYLLDHNGEKPW